MERVSLDQSMLTLNKVCAHAECCWRRSTDVPFVPTSVIPRKRLRRSRTSLCRASLCLAGALVFTLISGLAVPAGSSANGSKVFSLKLFRAIETNGNRPNLVVSPYSIAEALAMLSAGANGTTRTQIDSAIAGSKPTAASPPERQLLRQSLTATNTTGTGTSVSIANALWSAAELPLEQPFRATLKQRFDASTVELPFRTDPTKSARTINEWVSKATDSRIRKLVDPSSIDKNTRVVITNAVLFRGRWMAPFDATKTTVETFTLQSRQQIRVPTMHGQASTTGDSAQLIATLPFTAGYEMRIIAPSSSTRTSLTSAMAALHEPIPPNQSDTKCVNIPIAVPKWTASATIEDLQLVLKALGITDAFTSRADFTGMSQSRASDLQVTRVAHLANINVDEKGTIAAAATAITGEAVDTQPNSSNCPKSLAIDRPFVYVIQQNAGGEILFAGRVDNPNN